MITTIKSTISRALLAMTLALGGAHYVYAESGYPADVVRVYVPASPGGSTDAIARIFAKHFQNETGSSVAIVNQTGGGGIIAVQSVVRGKRNGGTLLLYHTALHVAHALKRSPFKYDKLTPMATLSVVNEVYAARADAPYDSLQDLLAFAKANPGKVTIGSEFGGTTQVKGQALATMDPKNFRVVDAGSESKRISSLLGNQVDVITMSVASAQQFEEAGDIKVLAVLNDEADEFEPEWPTAASQGVDAHLPQVFAIYGPQRIDPAVVEKFDSIMAKITQDPDYIQAVKRIRQSPSYRDSDATAEFMEKEYAAIKRIIDQQ